MQSCNVLPPVVPCLCFIKHLSTVFGKIADNGKLIRINDGSKYAIASLKKPHRADVSSSALFSLWGGFHLQPHSQTATNKTCAVISRLATPAVII